MGFQVSPGVNVSEIDLTTVVPAVSTTEGAIAGVFSWGPVEQRVLVASEDELVLRYGEPTSANFETFFTAANFLAYGNKLYVSRASANAFNALAGPSYTNATASAITVKNKDDYEFQGAAVANSGNSYYVAKYPGSLGNSLRVSVCDSSAAYTSSFFGGSNNTVTFAFTVGSNTATLTVTNSATDNAAANAAANTILNSISIGDFLVAGNTTIGTQSLKVTAKGAAAVINSSAAQATISLASLYSLSSNVTMASQNTSTVALTRFWEFASLIDRAPGTSAWTAARGGVGDEMHIVIVDQNGKFSGTQGAALEVFSNLSRATDALSEQGGSLYYKNVLNQSSKYVWWAYDRSGSASNTAVNMVAATNTIPLSLTFYGGTDGYDESSLPILNLAKAADTFKNAEEVDISLVLTGKSRGGVNGEQWPNYLIDNIAEYRKDCVVFVSPDQADTVNNFLAPQDDVVNFKNSIRSSSYAVVDSGYKYQYDKYNDTYRWVPLNGDIAGLCVRTDDLRDPWWSPAGFNRGQIKNIIKLSFNPDKARRDVLYKNGVNPVVTFPGQGTVLYGDKTALAKPSAFDRINVRRLFIVLEKAIATAAKYTLFEFNDQFTRAQFRNLIEPYLRDVQGRRGIYDFRVVCDETNNTAEVIDRNEFRGDIYIKPARSINFIQLNFVAVRTGVAFEEIVGKF